ncbi:hypothetical protein L7F22_006583 [Adiantum nelumboides]|nr:hypothetical protein [Adiantum nelumboides]
MHGESKRFESSWGCLELLRESIEEAVLVAMIEILQVGIVNRAMIDTGIVHSGALQVVAQYLHMECHRGSSLSGVSPLVLIYGFQSETLFMAAAKPGSHSAQLRAGNSWATFEVVEMYRSARSSSLLKHRKFCSKHGIDKILRSNAALLSSGSHSLQADTSLNLSPHFAPASYGRSYAVSRNLANPHFWHHSARHFCRSCDEDIDKKSSTLASADDGKNEIDESKKVEAATADCNLPSDSESTSRSMPKDAQQEQISAAPLTDEKEHENQGDQQDDVGGKPSDNEKKKRNGKVNPLKMKFKKMLIGWDKIHETFDSFPYYLNEHTKDLLIESAAAQLWHHKQTKFGNSLRTSSRLLLLTGPSDFEQEVKKEWDRLSQLENETVPQYVDKFWDILLKVTPFKIEDSEKMRKFEAGLHDALQKAMKLYPRNNLQLAVTPAVSPAPWASCPLTLGRFRALKQPQINKNQHPGCAEFAPVWRNRGRLQCFQDGGTEIYQENLVRALAKHLKASLLILDSDVLAAKQCKRDTHDTSTDSAEIGIMPPEGSEIWTINTTDDEDGNDEEDPSNKKTVSAGPSIFQTLGLMVKQRGKPKTPKVTATAVHVTKSDDDSSEEEESQSQLEAIKIGDHVRFIDSKAAKGANKRGSPRVGQQGLVMSATKECPEAFGVQFERASSRKTGGSSKENRIFISVCNVKQLEKVDAKCSEEVPWIAPIEAFAGLGPSPGGTIVYFPDLEKWMAKAVSRDERNFFVHTLADHLDSSKGPVLFITGRRIRSTSGNSSDREEFHALRSFLSSMRVQFRVFLLLSIKIFLWSERIIQRNKALSRLKLSVCNFVFYLSSGLLQEHFPLGGLQLAAGLGYSDQSNACSFANRPRTLISVCLLCWVAYGILQQRGSL